MIFSGETEGPFTGQAWAKGSVLTQGCSCAVGYHESRVQTAFSHQEGGQFTEGGVTEPFNSSFTDCSKFMDTDGQIVQGLKEHLSSFGLYCNMLSGAAAILKKKKLTLAGYSPWKFPPEIVSPRLAKTIFQNRLRFEHIEVAAFVQCGVERESPSSC